MGLLFTLLRYALATVLVVTLAWAAFAHSGHASHTASHDEVSTLGLAADQGIDSDCNGSEAPQHPSDCADCLHNSHCHLKVVSCLSGGLLVMTLTGTHFPPTHDIGFGDPPYGRDPDPERL
jgi:hypothetical protein